MFATDRSRIALVLAMVLLSAFLLTTLAGPGYAVDCSTTNISVTRVSASIMYVDTTITPQLRGTYVGYRITNSGAPIADAWVDITNFRGGVVDKAANESGRDHLGVLGSGIGASAYSYFYVAASGSTATAQTHDIVVYSGHPAFGGTEICTEGFSIQAVDDTIKANANKVNTVLAGPNPAELGGLMTMTVTGQTGQVGSGPPLHPDGQGVFVATPATDPCVAGRRLPPDRRPDQRSPGPARTTTPSSFRDSTGPTWTTRPCTPSSRSVRRSRRPP